MSIKVSGAEGQRESRKQAKTSAVNADEIKAGVKVLL